MSSDFKKDQAEHLRKQFGDVKTDTTSDENESANILSLPSRKERYKKQQEELKEKKKNDERKNKRKRRRVKFPLVRILLFLFLLLVILVLTYPNWIDRLNL